jgi:hypothetical protein
VKEIFEISRFTVVFAFATVRRLPPAVPICPRRLDAV